jgi:hypothetical protein
MSDDTKKNEFRVEQEIYHTQWTNIRHHWEQTFAGIKYLSILISLAIIPLKFLRIAHGGQVIIAADPYLTLYLKLFVGTLIGLMGLVTFLNQINHYQRSKQARTVVVNIEKKWNLYDKDGRFIYQEPTSKFAYSKFAGGENRLTNANVQFSYILIITITGILFVIFA